MQNNKITQENDSQSVAVVSYLQVVDDGDGVLPPTEQHGADLAPGSIRRIEFQDVVSVGVVATCIVLYYYTNCISNKTQIMSSLVVTRLSLLVPVITTLLSRVAPLRPRRGEGRAAE